LCVGLGFRHVVASRQLVRGQWLFSLSEMLVGLNGEKLQTSKTVTLKISESLLHHKIVYEK